MKTLHASSLAGALVVAALAPASAQLTNPEIGQAAPSFTLPDTHGKEHSLSDYQGQWVVLEWLNYGCPFVQKHYNSGNMQSLQSRYRGQGVVWFSVVSSAPGKQGYYEPDEMNTMNQEKGNQATAVLLDPEGTVGKKYGARTTPQMFLISPEGILLYDGAIDDRPSSDPASLEGATNYLVQAIDEAMAGKPVTLPVSQPYGCSVKYK